MTRLEGEEGRVMVKAGEREKEQRLSKVEN